MSDDFPDIDLILFPKIDEKSSKSNKEEFPIIDNDDPRNKNNNNNSCKNINEEDKENFPEIDEFAYFPKIDEILPFYVPNIQYRKNPKPSPIKKRKEEKDEFYGDDPYEISKGCDYITFGRRRICEMPEIRLCVNCLNACPHEKGKCKHTECSKCKTWFCHICLRVKHRRWNCGKAYRRCPVHPRSPINYYVFPKQTKKNENCWRVKLKKRI